MNITADHMDARPFAQRFKIKVALLAACHDIRVDLHHDNALRMLIECSLEHALKISLAGALK
ncbi:hypothetical protein D3C81_1288120 [compost metagenome]